MMAQKDLDCILTLMFRKTKIPLRTKEGLRRRLFSVARLSDDDMGYVAAAGEMLERRKNSDNA